MPYGVLVLSAAIAGIALDGVDNTVFAFLHDADMIGLTILRAGTAFVVPIKENDLTGRWFKAAVLPLSTVFEPLDTVDAARKLRDNAAVDIAALIGTPRNKAGAPFYTAFKSIPRPIGLTAHIADLRQGHRDDGIIPEINTIEDSRPHTAVFLGKQFRKLLSLVSVEIEKVCHFLGGLVADRDIEIGACDRRGSFHDVPVTVVGFSNDFLGLALGAGRYFVHLPENIVENGFLGIIHRGNLLRIVGIGGGFYRIEDEESVVDIWYVVVPNAVLTLCRPKSLSGKATYSKKQIETFTSGQISLFPEDNEDLSQYVEMYESDSDFHDQLKARAIYNKIACPIQVMLESTLQFQPKDGSDEYNSDMKAHLAWTHSSSLYYKLGCLPWKLDAVREGVCYVGLVFKKLQDTGKQKGYACSAAQMFLDSGDGVVFRGNIGPWISKNGKTFHLDRTSAKALLSIAIDAYYDKHKSYPKELFIHGRTAFTNDEWNGFQDAANISPTTNLVGVAIREKSGLRLLKDNTDPKSQYGILRGLCLYVDEKSGYLWTKGFIPKTETANHLEVACPLHIEINRGQADIKTVMRDILALTKLNYNACLYLLCLTAFLYCFVK